MTNIQNIMDGTLPQQTMVCVVFAVCKKVIHIMSYKVSVKYNILRDYIDILHCIINEKGRIVGIWKKNSTI